MIYLVIIYIITVIANCELSRERFEDFKQEIIDLVSCNDFVPPLPGGNGCAGLVKGHPDVSPYDIDDFAGVHPIIGGLIRLSFHDCGGIDPKKVKKGKNKFFTKAKKNGKYGGCNGCIGIPDNSANDNLLDAAILPIQDICDEYRNDGISRADCWMLAATFAIEWSATRLFFHRTLFGAAINQSIYPEDIPYYYGRSDCDNGYGSGESVYPFSNPDGVSFEFPNAELGWSHMSEFFKSRFGWNGDENYFTNRDIVAIMSGAHSVGRGHVAISGFSGSWDFSPETIDNEFVSILFGEDFFYTSDMVVQNLNQSMRDASNNKSKPQWSILQNDAVFEDFPNLLELDPPLTTLNMMFNVDFSMVYDLSYWIENNVENNITCQARADLLCTNPNELILTAPRGTTSVYNNGKTGEELGEQYECNEEAGEVCCDYIQCPIQCEGGYKQFQYLIDNNLIDSLEDDSNCPAGLAKKYSMNLSNDNVLRNRLMGIDFAKAFIKMITIGYVDANTGDVLLNVMPKDDYNDPDPVHVNNNKADNSIDHIISDNSPTIALVYLVIFGVVQLVFMK